MKMFLRQLLFSGLVLCLWHGAAAQGLSMGRTYYPEKLHQDLEEFRELVHTAHPDPYRYRTKEQLNFTFDSVKTSIDVPLTTDGFVRSMQPILKAIGDSHCRIELSEETLVQMRDRAAMIPITVKIIDGAFYVDEELKGFRSFPQGARLIRINGILASEILARLQKAIVCDGANSTLADRRIEREFRSLYYMHIERPSSFEIQFEDPNGEPGTSTIFAMSPIDIENSRKPSGTTTLPWGARWIPEISTMWLGLRTMDVDSLRAAGQDAEKFLVSMLRELKKNKGAILVVDLRGAGGRELGMAELVFGAIAMEPYRLVDNISIRSRSLPNCSKFIADHPDFYLDVSARYPRMLPDRFGVHPKDDRLTDLQPEGKAFKGKVYVLCDGYTRDAAAAFVMLAKRTGRARIVGEEVGTNAYTYTGGRDLIAEAPNSKVRFIVPLMRYTASGKPSGPLDHGELPNTELHPDPRSIARGSDSVKENLMMYIKETQ